MLQSRRAHHLQPLRYCNVSIGRVQRDKHGPVPKDTASGCETGGRARLKDTRLGLSTKLFLAFFLFFLRYNSYAIKITMLKYVIQCFLVCSRSFATITLIRVHSHHPQRAPRLVSSHSPLSATPPPPQSLAITYQLSFSSDLLTLGVARKRTHLVSGLQCLASCTECRVLWGPPRCGRCQRFIPSRTELYSLVWMDPCVCPHISLMDAPLA